MFTGLVADRGRVAELRQADDGALLEIVTSLALELAEGDSVAVNGVCLTATSVRAEGIGVPMVQRPVPWAKAAAARRVPPSSSGAEKVSSLGMSPPSG